MKTELRMASVCVALGTFCLCLGPRLWAQSANVPAPTPSSNNQLGWIGANAGCGYSTGEAPIVPLAPQNKSPQPNGGSKQPSLVLISARNDDNSSGDSNGAGIVGFWHVKFTAQSTTPAGILPSLPFPVDAGYSQWHSDGTEITNSAGRTPSIGNFCLGVWTQTGPRTYVLNHFAAAFDDSTSPATLIGPGNIREWVTLSSDGDSFTGSFTIDQYNEAGVHLVDIAGTISGTRIKVSTPESSIF